MAYEGLVNTMMTNKKLLYGLLAVVVAILAIGLFVLLKPTATSTTGGLIVINNSGGAAALAAECADESYVAERADYIIEGTVEKVESKWNEEERFRDIKGASIFTYTDLEIERYIKGEPFTEDKLRIVTPGGKMGENEISLGAEDQPIFHEGMKVRIYLQEENGEFSIVCGWAGVKEIYELQFEIYLAPRLLGVLSTEFPPGEPIEIMCILANESTSNVNVLRTEVGTLAIDFEIATPEGYVLHYAGPYWWHEPHVDTLAPGTCETLTIDITDSSYPDPVYYFRTDNIEHYEFTTEGDYSIRGIYRSDPSLVGDKSVENCLLYSTVRNFTIG